MKTRWTALHAASGKQQGEKGVKSEQLQRKLKDRGKPDRGDHGRQHPFKKKAEWGHLRGMWVEPDIRDAVVQYVGTDA
ncbi:MAG: hypothetical protein U5N56_09895 [Candidatus Marinimicrobia bacterium]|nr:hypothetical protein [Candidatus Neomarinimicrobiota bacterium]